MQTIALPAQSEYLARFDDKLSDEIWSQCTSFDHEFIENLYAYNVGNFSIQPFSFFWKNWPDNKPFHTDILHFIKLFEVSLITAS